MNIKKEKPKRYPKYLLTFPMRTSSKVEVKQVMEYRKKHGGIGYDEITDLLRALALFLIPRLELFMKETNGVRIVKSREENAEASDDDRISSFNVERIIKALKMISSEKQNDDYDIRLFVKQQMEILIRNIDNLWCDNIKGVGDVWQDEEQAKASKKVKN